MTSNANRFAIRSTLGMELGGDTNYPLFWNFTAWRSATPDRLLGQAEADRELARLQKSLSHDHTLKIIDVAHRQEGYKVMSVVREALREARLPNYDDMHRDERLAPEVKAVVADINAKARAAAIAAGYTFD